MIKRFLAILGVICLTVPSVFASDVWVNDLRSLFLSDSAVIYEINMRTFGAQDINKDGIIDKSDGEESGNFLNAISRLDELMASGVNTIHVMPVMAIGKTKALGAAGSLYSAASFSELNPQLKSDKTALSLEEQAVKFINEAHKRNIRVMIDLPACGAYDLYLKRPELFVKDSSGQPIIPSDWTDVRLLDAGDENNINQDVYNLYKGFVDYVMQLGVDGIRADVASTKPANFWKELISYSRKRDPQFMWLAEASDSWTEPVSPKSVFTPYDKLLEAGFDGFYASYFNMKDWRNASELMNHIKFTNSLKTKYGQPKAVIGSFTTHDELSPVLINGQPYSNMILWLNSTLPVNSYYVDGFDTGDNYIYLWGNKKARITYTDDEYYFVHRGKIDIFNFSRRPGGKNINFKRDFAIANGFKHFIAPIIANGRFVELKSNNSSVFAYGLSYNKTTVLVFGNMSFRTNNEAVIKVPHYNDSFLTIPVEMDTAPVSKKDKFNVNLMPGEIQVLLVNEFELK